MGKEATRVRRRERKNIASGVAQAVAYCSEPMAASMSGDAHLPRVALAGFYDAGNFGDDLDIPDFLK